jgi:penicillin-binding protein 1A
MRRRWGFRDVLWWMLRITNLALLVFIAGISGLLLGTYFGIAELIPEARDLGDIRPGQASRVLSADGEVLATVATEHRQFAQLEHIPEALQKAVIAVEDQGFYQHVGVDPRGIVRGILYGRGTSTVTQQLVRNVYLTQERKLSRKLAEIVLALQLERAYTKPEIMELYLNQIYFGEGAYGVQVASKTYFGKEVAELGLAECALLAGLPKAPERYSPFKGEQRSVDRRNLVLSMMVEEGFITEEESREAKEAELGLVEEQKPLGLNTFQAPYFTNYVLREVAGRYGSEAVYRGGLTIYTTLNLEMQRAAEEAIAWGMDQVQKRRFNANQAALVALDVRTGAIRAMVGGADYSQSQFNRTVQATRQAGSSFKPFVYTAALEQGYTPDSIVDDSEAIYPAEPGETWTPRNYDGKYHGLVTFREALAQSYNVSAVKVADAMGIGSVIETAERMGIYHEMAEYLPLAIGYSDVSPLEMASAYSVFATGGMRTEPYGIRKIDDVRGNTVEEHRVVTWRVLHERVADQMVDMLTTVVTSGTGLVTRNWFRHPAAGKTGTSNEFKDAWFIGFADDLCTAVWMGHDDFQPTARRGRAKGISGATIPAPIWAKFMQKARPVVAAARVEAGPQRIIEINPSEQGTPEPPVPPKTPPETGLAAPAEGAGVSSEEGNTRSICPMSGLLAGPHCPSAIQVTYDLEGDVGPPAERCDMHAEPLPADIQEERAETVPPPTGRDDRVTFPICAITGKIGTARCPVIRNQTFPADEAPTETCVRHARSTPGI